MVNKVKYCVQDYLEYVPEEKDWKDDDIVLYGSHYRNKKTGKTGLIGSGLTKYKYDFGKKCVILVNSEGYEFFTFPVELTSFIGREYKWLRIIKVAAVVSLNLDEEVKCSYNEEIAGKLYANSLNEENVDANSLYFFIETMVLNEDSKDLDVEKRATNGKSFTIKINGKKYSYFPTEESGLTAKELGQKFEGIAKHNKGRALSWLKKNATTKDSYKKDKEKEGESDKKDSKSKDNSEFDKEGMKSYLKGVTESLRNAPKGTDVMLWDDSIDSSDDGKAMELFINSSIYPDGADELEVRGTFTISDDGKVKVSMESTDTGTGDSKNIEFSSQLSSDDLKDSKSMKGLTDKVYKSVGISSRGSKETEGESDKKDSKSKDVPGDPSKVAASDNAHKRDVINSMKKKGQITSGKAEKAKRIQTQNIKDIDGVKVDTDTGEIVSDNRGSAKYTVGYKIGTPKGTYEVVKKEGTQLTVKYPSGIEKVMAARQFGRLCSIWSKPKDKKVNEEILGKLFEDYLDLYSSMNEDEDESDSFDFDDAIKTFSQFLPEGCSLKEVGESYQDGENREYSIMKGDKKVSDSSVFINKYDEEEYPEAGFGVEVFKKGSNSPDFDTWGGSEEELRGNLEDNKESFMDCLSIKEDKKDSTDTSKFKVGYKIGSKNGDYEVVKKEGENLVVKYPDGSEHNVKALQFGSMVSKWKRQADSVNEEVETRSSRLLKSMGSSQGSLNEEVSYNNSVVKRRGLLNSLKTK